MAIIQRGNAWRADVSIKRRGEKPIRRTGTFDTRAQAEAWVLELRGRIEKARSEGREVPPPGLTLRVAFSRYLKEVTEWSKAAPAGVKGVKSEKWLRDMRCKARMWASSPLADAALTSITESKLEDHITARRLDGKAENTIRIDLASLSGLFVHARKKWRLDIGNPAAGATAGVETAPRRQRLPSTEESSQIIELFTRMRAAQQTAGAAPRLTQLAIVVPSTDRTINVHAHSSLLYVRSAFIAAQQCAMRRESLLSIRWAWINWKDSVIQVPPAFRGPENKGVPDEVPMSPILIEELRMLSGNTERIGAALQERVFGTLTGDRAYRLLRRALKELNIDEGAGLRMRWHDQRHHVCSRMADEGWTLPKIQSVSGHKDLSSLSRYTKASARQTAREMAERAKEQRMGRAA